MNTAPASADSARDVTPPADPFDVLVPPDRPDVAADLSQRVVWLPDEVDWAPAAVPGLQLRTLELVRDQRRLTAQLRADGTTDPIPLPGAELLVQRGSVITGDVEHGVGHWLRLASGHEAATVQLSSDALVFLSIGQIPADDVEQRHVDSFDEEGWLDGPVEGCSVLPLHGRRSANVMLVRWDATAAFRPNLDPAGDEVFVISGTLHDANGSFGAGSWIRNPVPAWQSWAGTDGALVCYKSGHFATVADVESVPAAPHAADSAG